MKKVLTYGTFDLIHRGHINLLKRAKEFGDILFVGLSTDSFNQMKNKNCYYTFEERKYILKAIKYVDYIIQENNWEQKINDIKNNAIDVFVMGDDWKGKFDFLEEFCRVVYLPRTEGISTTKVKLDLKNGNERLFYAQ